MPRRAAVYGLRAVNTTVRATEPCLSGGSSRRIVAMSPGVKSG